VKRKGQSWPASFGGMQSQKVISIQKQSNCEKRCAAPKSESKVVAKK